MTVRVQKDIEKLKQRLLEMGLVIEEVFSKAVRCVQKRDITLAREIIEGDRAVDIAEVDLEEECLKTLALYQPVAADLRLIVAVMKINNDLERIGDLAVNIAERILTLSQRQDVELPFDFNRMSSVVRDMLKKSIDSLVKLDKQKAREVLACDEEIDSIHRAMYSTASENMRQSPNKIEYLLNAIAISRYLERIADHITNIAEDVIYLIEGEIVRHNIKEGQDKK